MAISPIPGLTKNQAWLRIGLAAVAVLALIWLTACYETASTYDPQAGRYRSTEDMKEEQRARERDVERRLERLERDRPQGRDNQ